MALIIVEDPKEVSGLGSAATPKSLDDEFLHLRFPMKVWRLASDPTFEPIKWSEDGKGLLIDELALEPRLGHLFRSNKFSSFLRQLHLYGFRKVSKASSFQALSDRNSKLKRKGRNYPSGIAEYAAMDFERDRFDRINEIRRYYGKAARGKKANRSSDSSSESSSQATLSEEHQKQLLAEHSYHLTEDKKQQQSLTAPASVPSIPTVPNPIMNRPLPSPYAETIPPHHVPPLNHGHFIYQFPHVPLIYSPSTGTYSPPGFVDAYGSSYGYCSTTDSQFSYSAFGSVVDQSSQDSGISDISVSSGSSNESLDASSFFHLMEPSQPWPVAYYPFPVIMPTTSTTNIAPV